MSNICIELYTHKHDYTNGVSLTKEELEIHRDTVAEKLANSPTDVSHATIRTGNMLTLARRNDGRIEVFQAEGYISYMYRIETLNEQINKE